jgi:hypothetical protein
VPGKNASSGSISRLGPQFPNRRSRIARPGLLNFTPRTPNAQNSNRECFRLETAVTRTKQTLPISSNREVEAYFSAAASTATLNGEVQVMQRPRWDSRAGTPASGVAGALIRLVVSAGEGPSPTTAKRPDQLPDGKKANSRPPTFVAIRKNYVIGFIRLKEVF